MHEFSIQANSSPELYYLGVVQNPVNQGYHSPTESTVGNKQIKLKQIKIRVLISACVA